MDTNNYIIEAISQNPYPLIITLILFFILCVYFGKISNRLSAIDKEQIDEVDSLFINEGEKESDVLELMKYNLKEIKGFYIMAKNHAKTSFLCATIASGSGFIVIIFSIYLPYFANTVTTIAFLPPGTIAGIVVEVISGLFFWICKKAMDQLNIYHKSLVSTQRILTAIRLVDKMSDKKDESYSLIISKILPEDTST